VDILVDVLKFVENLLKSGWVIVLGDSNYSIKYYSDVVDRAKILEVARNLPHM